ncbi:MAG: LacI family transcriptional regulator [Alkalinema sp. RL_2_19]|nr:LacI family transcriptional regulator [Alkalinema sp. RL_2_19]
MAAALKRHRIPAVWLNSKRDSDAVRPDDYGLAVALMEHLAELGHRHVVIADFFLAHTKVCHYSRADRLQGARDAATRCGITLHEWIPECPVDGRDPGSQAADVLRKHQKVTAVFGYCTDEVTAFQRAASLCGRRWPEDLAFVTFVR